MSRPERAGRKSCAERSGAWLAHLFPNFEFTRGVVNLHAVQVAVVEPVFSGRQIFIWRLLNNNGPTLRTFFVNEIRHWPTPTFPVSRREDFFEHQPCRTPFDPPTHGSLL